MRPPRSIAGSLVASAVLVLAVRARAADTQGNCTLSLRLEQPAPTWEAAVADLRPWLAEQTSDCRTVEVVTHESEARVIFTTADGRVAVRSLRAPGDLEPTVSALLVELPRDVEKPRPTAPLEQVTADSPHLAARQSNATASSPHVLLNGSAGARFAGPSPLVTPTISAGATLSLSGWDLGVAGTWCPSYASLGDDATRPEALTSLAAGVIIGRRVHIGNSVLLLGGVSLAAAFEHENWDVTSANGRAIEQESERGQMLFGAYGGVAFPARWKTRPFATLNADMDATHAGHTATTVTGAPELPWWGISLAVGVESEVL
jgi:hypothetical protein